MTLNHLISKLRKHGESTLSERDSCLATIAWLRKHGEFAFVKENLEGHITASLWITNPKKTKLLMMYHKKFQMWTQFGGHCDGEVDTYAVAIREFHEESGIIDEPNVGSDIFSVRLWDIDDRTSSSGMFQPRHTHYDILYFGTISENVSISPQESEVGEIRWFDIDGIERYIGERKMLDMIQKIKNLKHV